jgi:hypothetical protein
MPSTLTAPAPRPAAAPQYVEVTERTRAKVCSVVSYSESVLFRLPWATLRPDLRILPGAGRAVPAGAPAPGSCERLLFRALEWMAVDRSIARGVPFENPLTIHPRDLCERLCWRATQPQFLAIERGLATLTRVRIAGTGGAPDIAVLASAVPETRRLTNPSAICPNFVIHFDGRFVESVNAGRLVPVNWSLWVALHDAVARRLLEVLESEWPDPARVRPATFSLDALSAQIPLPPTLGAPQRRAVLDRAHQELLREEYLSNVTPLSGGRVRYVPGSTFDAMRQRLKEYHHRLLLAGIRTGWSLEGTARPRARLGHNIPRVASSP